MHLGEFLVAHEVSFMNECKKKKNDVFFYLKKYNIALFQCYQRYLNEFGSFHMQDFQTVDEIEEKFFPLGLSDVTADISVCLNECFTCLDDHFTL
jgi:sialic acid synthase SpsE